jgi:hypothetical protein
MGCGCGIEVIELLGTSIEITDGQVDKKVGCTSFVGDRTEATDI